MTEKKSILLRLNQQMWEEINRWAEEDFRSVNGQIEYLLKEAINKRHPNSSPSSPKSQDADTSRESALGRFEE